MQNLSIFAITNLACFEYEIQLNMDIISRLKRFMEHYQLSSSQFADTAGIPRPTLSQLLGGGRNKSGEGTKRVSTDIIRKIHDAYPSLNVMWLMFGDGEMVTSENTQFSEPQSELNFDSEPPQQSINQDIQNQILFDDEFSGTTSEKLKPQEKPILPLKESGPDNQPTQFSQIRDTQAVNTVAIQPDKQKKVQTIMVFYSDNSFEVFKPSE